MNKRSKSTVVYLCLVSYLCNQGCSTTGKSVAAGTAVGGAVGAATGALADPGKRGQNRTRNVVIGTGAGMLLGAGTGLLLDHFSKDDRKDSFENGKKEGKQESEASFASSSNAPNLIPARTEARWVPDLVRGTTFVPGHFEYVIVEAAKWERLQ